MKPLVSILIPAYNSEATLVATLQSALAQTWSNKEIVVVDDGSRDGSYEVARRFAGPRVLAIRQENRGAAEARNAALARCQGDYIQWLDADDLLSADKIALQMEHVERGESPQTLLSSGWAFFLSRPRRAKFTPTPLWADLSRAEWLIRKMGQNLHMQTATWLVSRELTAAAGPWDKRMLIDDDGEYFCRVLLASNGVKFVPGARTYYRMSGYSSVSYLGRSRPKLEAQLLSMKLHIKALTSLDQSARARAACVQYLQNWYVHYIPDHPDLMAEFQKLAADLGGTLVEPTLSWKYEWLRRAFGWRFAQQARTVVPRLKWTTLIQWDRFRARWESSSALS